MHPPGELGGRSLQSYRPGFKNLCDRCIPTQHSTAVPCGCIHVRCPISSQGKLHHDLHQSSTANGMGGLTIVRLFLLGDVGGYIDLLGRHRFSNLGLWRHSPPPSPVPPSTHTHTRASPILTVIWMTSYPWCRAVQNANTKSLVAHFLPSTVSYHHYRDSPKTW